jgi:hypothetical protein
MEVLVYLVLGLSIWILVPSERSALLGRAAERSAQGDERQEAAEDSDEASLGVAPTSRDR